MPDMFEKPTGTSGVTGCLAAPLIILVIAAVFTLITKATLWGYQNFWELSDIWQFYIAYCIAMVIIISAIIWWLYQRRDK